MKKLTITLLWVCYNHNIGFSQQSNHMQTYWTLRERFNKYFVRLGTNPGNGLPAEQRLMKKFDGLPFHINKLFLCVHKNH